MYRVIIIIISSIILFVQYHNSREAIHFYINTLAKSRKAWSDKNNNSCPKTFSKTVTESHDQNITKQMTRKINILMLFLKHLKMVVGLLCVKLSSETLRLT